MDAQLIPTLHTTTDPTYQTALSQYDRAVSFLNFPRNRRNYVTRRRFAFVLPQRCFAKR